jgi:hypothetical protein
VTETGAVSSSAAREEALRAFKKVQTGTNHTFVYDIDLYDGQDNVSQLQDYYLLCRQVTGVHVTTSCFNAWRQQKKTNAYGKVIPTSSSSDSTRVFFFDDNLELDGSEASSGITNLRDMSNGKYVDFAAGRNGFVQSRAGRHTVILHSTEYNCVLVKANILDAIEDQDYFTRIVQAHSQPGEKCIVFMDVNSTIVCNDTVQSKDTDASLLSTMFEMLDVHPRKGLEFGWGSCPPVPVPKRCSLKKLVKDITAKDKDAYKTFFSEANCRAFLAELSSHADVRWTDSVDNVTVDEFARSFREYLKTISDGVDSDGITRSWFRCADLLKANHSLMLNSFGVDTRKVVLATAPDESKVLQLAINYELWDKRDKDGFMRQFSDY